MTYHINFNICYLKLTKINGISMPDAIIMNLTIYIFQQALLSLIIILLLFYGKTAVKWVTAQ